MGERTQELLDRVRRTIDTYHMLATGETVLVAVSGGPDSMCLLDVLVAEEQWLAARDNRPARPRAELATLIDTSVYREAVAGLKR